MFEPTRCSSTLAKQRMLMLLASSPPHETTRSKVQFMVDNGNIHALKELADGDQTSFLEIVDQVRVHYLSRSPKVANFSGYDADYTKH